VGDGGRATGRGSAKPVVVASERSLGLVGRVALVGLLVAGLILASLDLLTLGFFVSYAAVGAYLVFRRPRNAIGWLLLAIGFALVGTTTPADLDVAALVRGDGTTRDLLVAWLNSWSGTAAFVGFLALTILFPAGRTPSGRWHRPAVAALAIGVIAVVLGATAPTITLSPDGAHDITLPNPAAVLPGLPIWDLPLLSNTIVIVIPLMIGGVVSILVRYRRSTGTLRLQLRWLVAGACFLVAALLFGLGTLAIFGSFALVAWIPAVFAYPMIPTAIGIAVLRYRLYEIDRIVSRTIGYGLVTGVLVIVFSSAVIAFEAVLAGVTETQGETLAVAASTLVAFALFQPLRQRIQRAVDRRFDRSRYDGERTSAAFSERLRAEVDLVTVTADLDTTVRAAMAPTAMGVWLRDGGRR
jgi:hypothetical protein